MSRLKYVLQSTITTSDKLSLLSNYCQHADLHMYEKQGLSPGQHPAHFDELELERL